MIVAAIKEIGVEDGFYILSGEQYIVRLVRGICAKLAAGGEKSSLDTVYILFRIMNRVVPP